MEISLFDALKIQKPLKIVGTVTAYTALMAEKLGHRAIYLSGAGVANSSYGLPDLGITELNDVLVDIQRITDASSLPLLVDADTGWGGAFNIARTVKSIIKAGAAGIHIEDQVQQKRCGHRPNKQIVSQSEMVDRIKAAADAVTDSRFMLMARTDALAVEGMDAAIERAAKCVEAGANAIFPEALNSIEQYQTFKDNLDVPILANITEFGKTPLFSPDQLHQAGVDIVLYPLTAFRAMNKAAENVYKHLASNTSESQEILLSDMQTRAELYDYLDYNSYEDRLDEIFGKNESTESSD